MVGKKSVSLLMKTIIEIVIMIIILMVVFTTVNTIMTLYSDQRALEAFEKFVKPIGEVCRGKAKATEGSIKLATPGKTYAIAQISVPMEHFFLPVYNSYGSFLPVPFKHKGLMEKCVGANCFCLIKIDEDPMNHNPWESGVPGASSDLISIIFSTAPKDPFFCNNPFFKLLDIPQCSPAWHYSPMMYDSFNQYLIQFAQGMILEFIASSADAALCAKPIATKSQEDAEKYCKKIAPECESSNVPFEWVMMIPWVLEMVQVVLPETAKLLVDQIPMIIPGIMVPLAFAALTGCTQCTTPQTCAVEKSLKITAFNLCVTTLFTTFFYPAYQPCAESVRQELFMPTTFYFPYPQHILACSANPMSLLWSYDSTAFESDPQWSIFSDCPDLTVGFGGLMGRASASCGGTSLLTDLINTGISVAGRSIGHASRISQLNAEINPLQRKHTSNELDKMDIKYKREQDPEYSQDQALQDLAKIEDEQVKLEGQIDSKQGKLDKLKKMGVSIVTSIIMQMLFAILSKFQDVENHDCGWYLGGVCKDYGCRINPLFPMTGGGLSGMIPDRAQLVGAILYRVGTNCLMYGTGMMASAIKPLLQEAARFVPQLSTLAEWGPKQGALPNPFGGMLPMPYPTGKFGSLITDNCLDRAESVGFMLSYKRWTDMFSFGCPTLMGSPMPRNMRVETYDKEIFTMSNIDVLRCVRMDELCNDDSKKNKRVLIWRWQDSFTESAYINFGEMFAPTFGSTHGSSAMMQKWRRFMKALKCFSSGADVFSCVQHQFFKGENADTFNGMIVDDILPNLDVGDYSDPFGALGFGGTGYLYAFEKELLDIVNGKNPSIGPTGIYNVNDVGLPALRYFQAWVATPDPWDAVGDSGDIEFLTVEQGPHKQRSIWPYYDAGSNPDPTFVGLTVEDGWPTYNWAHALEGAPQDQIILVIEGAWT